MNKSVNDDSKLDFGTLASEFALKIEASDDLPYSAEELTDLQSSCVEDLQPHLDDYLKILEQELSDD